KRERIARCERPVGHHRESNRLALRALRVHHDFANPARCVANEQVSRAIEGNAPRRSQLRGSSHATIPAETICAITRNRRYHSRRSVHPAYAVVVRVRDEQVSPAVHGHPGREPYLRGCGRSTVPAETKCAI